VTQTVTQNAADLRDQRGNNLFVFCRSSQIDSDSKLEEDDGVFISEKNALLMEFCCNIFKVHTYASFQDSRYSPKFGSSIRILNFMWNFTKLMLKKTR
jgi:hypothetical protein